MVKKKIIILGNLPLATKIIKFVQSLKEFELVGVICPKQEVNYINKENEVCAYKYCTLNNIKILNIENIHEFNDLDIAISARNNNILKESFLHTFSLGVVNCHGGFLPDYKGVGGHIFPIINKEEFSGASIHWMTKKVDKGNIIDRKKVFISPRDTGFSLYLKINDALMELIKKNLLDIINKKIDSTPQEEFCQSNKIKKDYYYWQKDVTNLINTCNENSPLLYEKALYWPGKPTSHPEYFKDFLLKSGIIEQYG